MTLALILLLCALVCFLLEAFALVRHDRVNLIALGLALLVFASLVGGASTAFDAL